MSTNRYVVLRTVGPTRRSSGPAGADAPVARGFSEPDGDDVAVEAVDLSQREVADLRLDPGTRAVARPMPMKLIEPVASGGDEDHDRGRDGDVAWGVRAVAAPRSPFDGDGVVVAILDTGIDRGHPAFTGVELDVRNFTSEGDDDTHGHGTHCAGTIFGRDVEGIRIGVAPGVRRARIAKVLGEGGGTSAQIAEAILWAVHNGAHVISMSLGIDFPGYVQSLVENDDVTVAPATSMALEQYRANVDLFEKLAGQVQALGAFIDPAMVVAASGNESQRPRYSIAVAPPAVATGIVSVGALGRTVDGLVVASFSNNEVSVAAPGVDILSAVPGGGLALKSGTSMAAPHVAGVAALWAQKLQVSSGAREARTLTERVVGSATMKPMASSVSFVDVGQGIVQAPSD